MKLDHVPEGAHHRQAKRGETQRLVPLVQRKLQHWVDRNPAHDEAEGEQGKDDRRNRPVKDDGDPAEPGLVVAQHVRLRGRQPGRYNSVTAVRPMSSCFYSPIIP
ncbi:hypothetical protein D9M70_523690 [compost metagenome]